MRFVAVAASVVLLAAVPAHAEPPADPAAHVAVGEGSVPVPSLATSDEPPIEIVVQGQSAADRLRESARAVHVVELDEAKRQSSDLGEVLARSPGVAVRREGGLGSESQLSLYGLSDDQVRVFLGGVPLGLAGYPLGIANVPVNLIERVEVYRGVVPIRFGADALGGAINLVTDDDVRGTHAAGSYQAGSFGTQRFTVGVRTRDEPSGFFTRASVFHDVADNDYPVDVEWPDDQGQLESRRAYRFHDAYRATGANVEAGLVDRSWARRLLFRAFVTDHAKELQHGTVMAIPYGDTESRQLTAGGTVRYLKVFRGSVALDALGGYTEVATQFLDPDRCLYDWWGQCIREPEIPDPKDILTRSRTLLSRVNLEWRVQPAQALRLSVAPTFSTIVGDERAGADPNDGDQRELFTFVPGLEHELSVFDDRLENIAFVKGYLQAVRADEHVGDITLDRSRTTLQPGFGDSLRYRFTPWLYAKASYEYATRLPTLYEIFGDGLLMLPNLELEPETSHNANLGAALDAREAATGSWYFELNGFLREAEHQIIVLRTQDLATHQNVFGARSLGAEAAGRWTVPGDLVTVSGNVTYLDFRNTSTEGAFAPFEGDRIPNRPYFFANGSVRLLGRGIAAPSDELSLTWFTRYVHEFYRSWESIGQRNLKEVIPSQLLHTLVLGYDVQGQTIGLGHSLEIQNLTDAKAYDYFGVQRPGRAFYYKITAEL